jgi:hypothetical protein
MRVGGAFAFVHVATTAAAISAEALRAACATIGAATCPVQSRSKENPTPASAA